MTNIDDVKYLWDSSEPSWGLLAFNDDDGKLIYTIINFDTRACLLIENEDKKKEVIRKMQLIAAQIMTAEEFKSLPPLKY